MRALCVVALGVFVASGCSSVTLSQRNGCWVRASDRSFLGMHNRREELGPCVRPQPTWSEDRLTRLVQECATQADYRWAATALEAWGRGSAYPARPPQPEILKVCMDEARAGLALDSEGIKATLASSLGERDELRRQLAQDHAALRSSADRLAEFLGEAAKKPPGTATATATATGTGDGKATNDSGATLAAEARAPLAGAPTLVTAPAATPAPAPVTAASGPTATATDAQPAAKPLAACGPAPKRARAPGRARRALVETAARGCPVPAPAPAPAAD